MKAAINAVIWDVFWKNRVVFPVLGLLLAVAAGLGFAIRQAAEGASWPENAKGVVVFCFLLSVLLSFAPFMLVENSGGWRMNSTITRWFALPVKTVLLAYLPVLAGAIFLGVMMTLWQLILSLSLPGLDAVYFCAVMIVGHMAINALAWTVPRKPVQYWIGVGLLVPVLLILGFAPQDQNAQFRRGMLIPLSYVAVILLAYTWVAATKTRCGAWSGELPAIFDRFRTGQARKGRRPYRWATTALFRMEGVPPLKTLVLSWGALVAALYFYISFMTIESNPYLAFSWRILPLAGMGVLPVLGVLWMAGWGLLLAGEPAAPFRSRFSSHKATLPVTSGLLAGQKVTVLFIGWCFVWLPLVVASFFYTPEILGIETENVKMVQQHLVGYITVGAFVVTGALPLLLLGRLEGFPNVLLASIGTWAVAWLLKRYLNVEDGSTPGKLWVVLGLLLAAKFSIAAWAFAVAAIRGHTTGRYPLVVITSWSLITMLLLFVLPGWSSGAWVALNAVLFLPLARIALCPLAVAKNRHG
jgi:hypothetical protein